MILINNLILLKFHVFSWYFQEYIFNFLNFKDSFRLYLHDCMPIPSTKLRFWNWGMRSRDYRIGALFIRSGRQENQNCQWRRRPRHPEAEIGRTGRWSSQILYNFDGYLIIYRCNNFWHGIDPQLVGSMNVEVRRNQTQIEFRWLDIWIGTLDRVLSVDPPAIAADIKNKAEFSMDKSFFLRWAHEPFISG